MHIGIVILFTLCYMFSIYFFLKSLVNNCHAHGDWGLLTNKTRNNGSNKEIEKKLCSRLQM